MSQGLCFSYPLSGPIVPCAGFPVGKALAWGEPPQEKMDFIKPPSDPLAHMVISELATGAVTAGRGPPAPVDRGRGEACPEENPPAR